MFSIGSSIGMALWLGSGTSLINGGPAAIFLGYCIAVGWAYWFSASITLANELQGVVTVLSFWTQSVPTAVWLSVFLVVILIIVVCAVKIFGEAEAVMSTIKLFWIVVVIISCIIISAGGAPNHHKTGFEYWNSMPFTNGFKGFLSVMGTCIFAMGGTEFSGIAAAEARNPLKSVPKAVNSIWLRLTLFYVVGGMMVTITVSPKDPDLFGGEGINASPYVIAFRNAGIPGLAHAMNAIIFISVVSSGNAQAYAATRTVVGLANIDMAPAIFKKCDRLGRPWAAIFITFLVGGGLCYLNVTNSGATVFGWFSNLTALCILWLWGTIFLSHLRFRMAWKAQSPILAVNPRDAPKEPTGVKTITSPNGSTIRYKEPGEEGICETTPGVKSYSGYIDITPDIHVFFWFFESKRDPKHDPVTLWLNGGPGSDSLIGLFEELGPCTVAENMTTVLRDHSWTEVSNLLFLSQPVGTGFSYSTKEVGSLDPTYLTVESTTNKTEEGRWSVINVTALDTSRLAAESAWELLQGFYSALPNLDADVESTDFNLWTESFGGHWGPSFSTYFYEQTEKLPEGGSKGRKLNFKSLGIINGIIDEPTQTKYLLEFTKKNTYGVQLINDTVYDHGAFSLYMPDGCQDQLDYCNWMKRETSIVRRSACAAAQYICQTTVEGLFYRFGDRGTYDIRKPTGQDVPPSYWRDYLNTAPVQNALGVDLNYTSSNLIYTAFSLSGDFAAPYLPDLEKLLGLDIQISLVYGDATTSVTGSAGRQSPRSPNGRDKKRSTMLDFQPAAALQIFNRTINGFDIATGEVEVSPGSDYATNGTAETTHTTTLPPLASSTSG
ncbi:carboxypeptidase S1 [Aspergillus arachidicola]|uniref:Carboxypeptidase S1 n=1 Tax=Aspergillus arachidicola TaxID=656916 RepID=A0A2G7FKH3_9EURO|nr:carboxypeptidase S1 [Aspergillus arachidicola]